MSTSSALISVLITSRPFGSLRLRAIASLPTFGAMKYVRRSSSTTVSPMYRFGSPGRPDLPGVASRRITRQPSCAKRIVA
jgi:hypothetical protein